MPFLMHQLQTGSIGEAMRSLRKRQGFSQAMVAQRTHVQRKYIDAFEHDAYHNLPDPLYARHFLKQIIEALHGDSAYFIARFDEECGTCPAVVDALRTPRQRISKHILQHWRSIVSRLMVGALALALLVYVGGQVHRLLSPPALLVDSPSNNLQTAAASLVVSGQTEGEAQVQVNGTAILTDPTGRFEAPIVLTRGLNIITVEARRKHGRPQIVERTVYLEGLEGPLKTSSTAPLRQDLPHHLGSVSRR